MTKFIITEKQDRNSTRAGEVVEAKSLTAAKRKASSLQFFQGTVMTIESENGTLLSWKDKAGKWSDA